MQVIDQINGSALFAQSAYSASVATKDDLGRYITATYLTSHQDISNLMPKSESANFYPMEGNPSGFLTAHQAISAEEWNDCYDNVNTNSGAWGGDALPITGRDGIDLEIDNGTLYIGASALTGQGGNPEVESYVQTNSANIDETVGCVQTNSASWGVGGSGITGVSHDNTLSGDGTVVSPLGVVNGYNETVIWEGTGTHYPDKITTNEPLSSFERFKVIGYIPYADNMRFCIENDFSNGGYTTFSTNQFAPSLIRFFNTSAQMLNDGIQLCSAVQGGLWLNTTGDTATVGKWYDVTRSHYIQKVIGINHK